MKHRDKKLDNLLGQYVHIEFLDGQNIEGILEFAETFSAKYGWKKPNFYYCGNYGFSKSHVKNIKGSFNLYRRWVLHKKVFLRKNFLELMCV